MATKVHSSQLNNTYAFSVYRNAAWTPGTTGENTVPWDTKLFDPNNNFSTGTYKYTVPVTGIYQINARFSGGTNTRTFFVLNKNAGVGVARGSDYSHSAAPGTGSIINTLVPLTAGDTLYTNIYFAAVAAAEVGLTTFYFNGYLVAAT